MLAGCRRSVVPITRTPAPSSTLACPITPPHASPPSCSRSLGFVRSSTANHPAPASSRTTAPAVHLCIPHPAPEVVACLYIIEPAEVSKHHFSL